MNDMLVKNTEIESEDTQVAESVETCEYELRPLVAGDMGTICKIISAIGIRQFKECFNIDTGEFDLKNMKNVEKVGIGIMIDIAGVIVSNIPRAEKEIQSFVSSVAGIKLADVVTMPIADYGELIVKIVMKDDFKDFFKRVMKLLNL